MELWKDVVGYEGYYKVNNAGVVIGLAREIKHAKGKRTDYTWKYKERIMKPKLDRDGYLIVSLSANAIKKSVKVHRIVGAAFLPKEEYQTMINHKNAIRHDNRVENLEWVSGQENVDHCKAMGRTYKGESHVWFGVRRSGVKNSKSKLVLDLNTGIFYECVFDASVAKGINYSTLRNKLRRPKINNTSLIPV